MSIRDAILDAMYCAAEWSESTYEEHQAECVRGLNAYRAEILREVQPTDHERWFLKFMVDTVQEVMLTHDGFTDEDEAALDRFKAMAEGDA